MQSNSFLSRGLVLFGTLGAITLNGASVFADLEPLDRVQATAKIVQAKSANRNHVRTKRSVLKDEVIEPLLASMSLDQKIGQLLMFGFHGKSLTRQQRQFLQQVQPGGLILFGHNLGDVTQIYRLTSELRNMNPKIPPFIAVDQEGGSVVRVKISPPFPSALAIGQTKNANLSERVGFITGEILSALGINMNLAPVLDVADPKQYSFIGNRSFSGDPKNVSKVAVAYAEGLMMSGIVPTAKHFPGHGNTAQDSHKTLPQRHISWNQLKNSDLLPFRDYSRLTDMSAMMVAHVAYPKVDKSRRPASHSPVLIKNVLRRQLGYQGLVITDDLDMKAAKNPNGVDALVSALNAGSDMIMVAWSRQKQKRSVAVIKKAIQNGRLRVADIDRKVRRILRVKNHYLMNKPKPSLQQLSWLTKSKYVADTFYEITKTNYLTQQIRVEQFRHLGQPTAIITGSMDFANAVAKVAKQSLPVIPMTRSLTPQQLTKKLQAYPGYKFIAYVSGYRSAKLIRELAPQLQRRLLAVSVTKPYYLSSIQHFAGRVDLYSPHPKIGQLVGHTLFRGPLAVARNDEAF